MGSKREKNANVDGTADEKVHKSVNCSAYEVANERTDDVENESADGCVMKIGEVPIRIWTQG